MKMLSIMYALLFHDAGYHEDYKGKGFDSKEEYSASLAESAMKKEGVNEDLINKTKEAIMATHRDAEFTSVEQKVVRASDLAGLASEYGIFLENNKKLKAEAEMLSGNSISDADWKKLTTDIVEFYLSQDIHLTKGYEDKDGESLFHKKARQNLEKFLAS